MIAVRPLDWMQAMARAKHEEGVTHIVDFGPGDHQGIGSVTAHNINGSGVHIITASAWKNTTSGEFLRSSKSVLFEDSVEKVPVAVHWGTKYKPHVLRRIDDNKLFLDTKFTRVVGK
jgi:fatty acid synthase subunit beta